LGYTKTGTIEKALIKPSFRHLFGMNADTTFERKVFHENYNA